MFTGRQYQMTKKLYVTNISSETTEAEITDLFAQIGAVVSVRIAIHPKTGRQRNYGFVEMESPELAQAAEQTLNNQVLHEHKLQLSVVLPREQRQSVPSADLSPIRLNKPSRNIGRPRSR
jgi:RNA recognition motif-containing protein